MPGSLKTHGFLYESRKLDSSYRLYSPTLSESGELDTITYINEYVNWVGTPITIKVGKYVVHNIYGANKVDGTPKADISLVSFNPTTKKFENSLYISHKMGASASSFLRYGGVSTKADGSKIGAISKHKEVVSFLKDLSHLHAAIVNQRSRVYRPISDKNLIAKAVYGPEYNTAKHNENNVHAICQGFPAIRKYGEQYSLSFSTGMITNPDVVKFSSGDYAAVLEARFDSTSSYEVNGKRYSGVRVSISPKAVAGRTAKEL